MSTFVDPPIPTDPSLPTICFDLDGVLAQNVWPSPWIGAPIMPAVRLLRELHTVEGYEIVVYTSRPESQRENILIWLRRHALDSFVYDVICGKPRAALYIDDRAFNPWKETA